MDRLIVCRRKRSVEGKEGNSRSSCQEYIERSLQGSLLLVVLRSHSHSNLYTILLSHRPRQSLPSCGRIHCGERVFSVLVAPQRALCRKPHWCETTADDDDGGVCAIRSCRSRFRETYFKTTKSPITRRSTPTATPNDKTKQNKLRDKSQKNKNPPTPVYMI